MQALYSNLLYVSTPKMRLIAFYLVMWHLCNSLPNLVNVCWLASVAAMVAAPFIFKGLSILLDVQDGPPFVRLTD